MNQKSNVSNPLFAALEWLNKPFNVSSRREAGLPLTGRQRAFAKTVEQEALQRLKLPTKVNYISEPRDVIRTLLPVGKAPRFRINLSSTNPFIAAHEIGHGMNDRSLARVLSVNPIAGVIDGLLGTGKPMNAGLDRQWAIRAAVEKNRRLPMTTRQLSYGSAARGGGALLSAAYALNGGENPWLLYGLPFAGYVPSALNEGLATARGLRLAGRFGAGFGRGKLPVLRQMRGFGGLMAGTASYLTIPAATAIFNWVTANRKAK